MRTLEGLLGLFVAAVILAAAARRVGAPYPVLLAVGGALLAFLPGAPTFSIPPELVLALFVARVLLDAAYDASLRDLRDNWAPGLATFEHDRSPVAELVRKEFTAYLSREADGVGSGAGPRDAHADIHRRALEAARQTVFKMRADEQIGDDAFHLVEAELDRLEMATIRDTAV
jgi:hypothetical protein